ncbi:hypothetical protein [Agromyces bauzanensis]
MPTPTGQQVADYLDRGDDTQLVALAGVHLPLVSAMVKAYTRGVGFTIDVPDETLEAVIVSACARLTANPDGTITEAVDDYQTRRTVFEGFNLIERAVLDGYRRKAA